MRKFCVKSGNYAKKNTKISRKNAVDLKDLGEGSWTDRNSVRYDGKMEKSNSLHQTFIKVKEKKNLI